MATERTTGRPPAGEGKPTKARLLEAGAAWLQDNAPVKQFDVYMVGFHCARHEPSLHMEAHHYCHQVNGEFFQCLVFDGNGSGANLIGVEYIISERLFEQLPPDETQYWHPHNYEVFSGELIAPGLPDAAEKAMLKFLLNSYGKTWHTWHSTHHDLPLGEPRLMWSFNRDGQVDSGLKRDRDQSMQLDPDHKRRSREDLLPLAHPQAGVDLLDGDFPQAGGRPAGVRDRKER
jgi:hypothetical protein